MTPMSQTHHDNAPILPTTNGGKSHRNVRTKYLYGCDKDKSQQEFCFPLFSFSPKLPTCPGPTYKQVALSWQPPLPGSRQLLITTQSLPSPVQPCWHTQTCAPVPVRMHSACRKNRGKTFETIVSLHRVQCRKGSGRMF